MYTPDIPNNFTYFYAQVGVLLGEPRVVELCAHPRDLGARAGSGCDADVCQMA